MKNAYLFILIIMLSGYAKSQSIDNLFDIQTIDNSDIFNNECFVIGQWDTIRKIGYGAFHDGTMMFISVDVSPSFITTYKFLINDPPKQILTINHGYWKKRITELARIFMNSEDIKPIINAELNIYDNKGKFSMIPNERPSSFYGSIQVYGKSVYMQTTIIEFHITRDF